MPNQDKERVRRILVAVLEKLDGNPGDREERPVLVADGSDSNSPVIVLLGGSNSGAQDGPSQPAVDELARPAPPNLTTSAYGSTHASHPGLERFPLAETQSNPAAPKTCFMEPGRTCVGSGACEMRGY